MIIVCKSYNNCYNYWHKYICSCSITHKLRPDGHTPQYFDLENGAVTSEHGYQTIIAGDPYQDRVRDLAPGVFQILNLLDQGNLASCSEIEPLCRSFKLLYKHIEYRLHREIKSWKLLEPVLELAMPATLQMQA